MSDEDILARLERFERTVATCLCAVPTLFSAQCLFASLSAPVFAAMFKDFGAKLPRLTQFVLASWPIWAIVGVALPIVALVIARKARSTFSVIFSTVAGLLIFIVAQCVSIALFLPIFELGAVSGGAR